MTTQNQDNKKSAPEPYINAHQAAAYLSLPVNTIYKLALARQIPSYKLGKLRRFRLSEISAVMESARVAAGK